MNLRNGYQPLCFRLKWPRACFGLFGIWIIGFPRPLTWSRVAETNTHVLGLVWVLLLSKAFVRYRSKTIRSWMNQELRRCVQMHIMRITVFTVWNCSITIRRINDQWYQRVHMTSLPIHCLLMCLLLSEVNVNNDNNSQRIYRSESISDFQDHPSS